MGVCDASVDARQHLSIAAEAPREEDTSTERTPPSLRRAKSIRNKSGRPASATSISGASGTASAAHHHTHHRRVSAHVKSSKPHKNAESAAAHQEDSPTTTTTTITVSASTPASIAVDASGADCTTAATRTSGTVSEVLAAGISSLVLSIKKSFSGANSRRTSLQRVVPINSSYGAIDTDDAGLVKETAAIVAAAPPSSDSTECMIALEAALIVPAGGALPPAQSALSLQRGGSTLQHSNSTASSGLASQRSQGHSNKSGSANSNKAQKRASMSENFQALLTNITQWM